MNDHLQTAKGKPARVSIFLIVVVCSGARGVIRAFLKSPAPPPATKDDLKKVVYKQLGEKGPMSPETKKKVDQGIDTIFEKVELTTAKAKDLEKPEAPAGGTTPVESPVPQIQQKPAQSPP
jgi:hypothetical protein